MSFNATSCGQNIISAHKYSRVTYHTVVPLAIAERESTRNTPNLAEGAEYINTLPRFFVCTCFI